MVDVKTSKQTRPLSKMCGLLVPGCGRPASPNVAVLKPFQYWAGSKVRRPKISQSNLGSSQDTPPNIEVLKPFQYSKVGSSLRPGSKMASEKTVKSWILDPAQY